MKIINGIWIILCMCLGGHIAYVDDPDYSHWLEVHGYSRPFIVAMSIIFVALIVYQIALHRTLAGLYQKRDLLRKKVNGG